MASTSLYDRLSRLNINGSPSRSSHSSLLKHAYGVTLNGINLTNLHPNKARTASSSHLPTHSVSNSEMKRNVSLLNSFSKLPTMIDPKTLCSLRQSVDRLAHSESNISIKTTVSVGTNTAIPRRPTTIHVSRKKDPKISATQKRKSRKSISPKNRGGNKIHPSKKSWKDEEVLSNYTTMNPTTDEIESLSVAELEKKIDEKVSRLMPTRVTPSDENNLLIVKKRSTKNKSKAICPTPSLSSKRARSRQIEPQSRLPSKPWSGSSHGFPRSVSSSKTLRSSSKLELSFTPSVQAFVDKELPTRILKNLQEICLQSSLPKTPVSVKAEYLNRLKKAYDIVRSLAFLSI
jgi:hypothetical protein